MPAVHRAPPILTEEEESAPRAPHPSPPPPLPDLGPLREAGVPTVDDAAFAAAASGLAERRRWLRGLLEANGWDWLTVDDTA